MLVRCGMRPSFHYFLEHCTQEA
uniref:Uncharacterized protein n=1 Tax=Anguilla anguilla TaxID=7936 RepID=A0A0E9VX45_ANGAN